MGVSPAHVVDELDLLRPVLVWVAVRPVRTILQGLEGPVVPFQPAIDILAVCPVTDRCFRDTIFLRVVN